MDDGAAVMAAVDGDVVFVAVLADVLEESLEGGHLHHAVTAKALEFVAGDFAFTDVRAHAAVEVVRRSAAECQWPALEPSNDGPEGVLLADRRRNDFLKVHLEVFEKVFRSEERRVGKECRSRWSP